MTPEAIVAEAIKRSLDVIALTDHNSIQNVQATIDAAAETDLLVIPGVELSTSGGHILVYTETVELLQHIIGHLSFNDNRTACQASVADVLRITGSKGGIAIAAHIDLDSGFEAAISSYGDPKEAIVTSPVLVALEISSKQAIDWYTDRDLHEPRRQLAALRIERLGDPFTRTLPKVQSSDAHSLSKLGRNATEETKLTRLKMADRTWTSFRAAFSDPESRVRLEAETPEWVPQFISMKIDGGFIDGQVFPFSPNLTCIIGGRGSGKSTAFSALRAATGLQPTSNIYDSEAWPDSIELLYQDELGAQHRLRVDEERNLVNISDPTLPAPPIQVNSLEQGDMARTIEKCGQDPSALLDFLDGLVDFGDISERIDSCRDDLNVNGRAILELEAEQQQYDTIKKNLDFKLHQQEEAKKANSEKLIKYQEELASEMRIREKLGPTFKRADDALRRQCSTDALDELALLAEECNSIVSSEQENPIPGVAKVLKIASDEAWETMSTKLKASKAIVSEFDDICKKRHEALKVRIKEEADKLQKKGIKLNLRFLRSLSSDVQEHKARLKKLTQRKKELKNLMLRRRALLKEFRSFHSERYLLRQALSIGLQNRLRDFLVDWNISISFGEARLSKGAEAALKESMEWRTSAMPKAPALIQSLGVPALLDAIQSKDANQLTNANDGKTISEAEAAHIIQKLSELRLRQRLEEETYDDLPRIVVSRFTVDGSGKKSRRPIKREFHQLSLGQQQSIVLAILLSVDDKRPLLIDQPEDNLDSAFIYQILVRALRRTKETRQVILVTHNANIAVLGDADLVIPLKATAERGRVLSPGTVESPKTRQLVCEILEGGKDAYLKRGELYGLGN